MKWLERFIIVDMFGAFSLSHSTISCTSTPLFLVSLWVFSMTTKLIPGISKKKKTSPHSLPVCLWLYSFSFILHCFDIENCEHDNNNKKTHTKLVVKIWWTSSNDTNKNKCPTTGQWTMIDNVYTKHMPYDCTQCTTCSSLVKWETRAN